MIQSQHIYCFSRWYLLARLVSLFAPWIPKSFIDSNFRDGIEENSWVTFVKVSTAISVYGLIVADCEDAGRFGWDVHGFVGCAFDIVISYFYRTIVRTLIVLITLVKWGIETILISTIFNIPIMTCLCLWAVKVVLFLGQTSNTVSIPTR